MLRATLLACTLLAPSATAGDVWVVDAGGGGDYVTLQAAVDAAADGDVLLVESGTYAGFTISHEGLAVVADDGAVVVIDGGIRVEHTLVEHEVVLVGLESRGTKALVSGTELVRHALALVSTRGPVRVEACVLRGADGFWQNCAVTGQACCTCAGDEPVHAELALDVSFAGCTLVGGAGTGWFDGFESNRGGDGLVVTGGSCALYDCEVRGGDGGSSDSIDNLFQGGNGGHGARVVEHALVAATLFASGTTLAAGAGGDGDPCLELCGHGGHGVLLVGATTLGRFLDCDVQAGAGGCPGCPPPYPGAAGSKFERLGGARRRLVAGLARSLAATNPAREATAATLTITGAPGDAVLLLAGAPAHGQSHAWHGALLLEVPGLTRIVPLGTVPGTGTLQTTLPIPTLPAGLDGTTIYAQGLHRDVAGAWWLASPATLVVLDSSF